MAKKLADREVVMADWDKNMHHTILRGEGLLV